MPTHSQDYALVIGINHYPNYGSHGRPLRGAIKDAKAFREWLIDKNAGGGLPEENCKLIISSVNTVDPPQPRKSKIDDALDQIWQMSEQTGARRLYFYFSGHGQSQLNNDVFLCMSNWAKNRQAAALSFRKYIEVVINCMTFKEVVVLLDCCRSRKVGAKGQESELTCAKPHDHAGDTEMLVAHATEFQTVSFEAETGDVDDSDEPIVRGHFTEALLKALHGAAARTEGGVLASELLEYLYKVVPRIALRHNHVQKPKFEPFGIPAGLPEEPVFGNATRIETVDVVFTFSSTRTGEILIEGPDLRQIRKGDVSTGPWRETLELATYMLTDVANGEQMSVHLQPTIGEFHVTF